MAVRGQTCFFGMAFFASLFVPSLCAMVNCCDFFRCDCLRRQQSRIPGAEERAGDILRLEPAPDANKKSPFDTSTEADVEGIWTRPALSSYKQVDAMHGTNLMALTSILRRTGGQIVGKDRLGALGIFSRSGESSNLTGKSADKWESRKFALGFRLHGDVDRPKARGQGTGNLERVPPGYEDLGGGKTLTTAELNHAGFCAGYARNNVGVGTWNKQKYASEASFIPILLLGEAVGEYSKNDLPSPESWATEADYKFRGGEFDGLYAHLYPEWRESKHGQAALSGPITAALNKWEVKDHMSAAMPWHSTKKGKVWADESSWSLEGPPPQPGGVPHKISGRQWRDAKLFHAMYHYSQDNNKNSKMYDSTWTEVYAKAINVRGIIVGSSDQAWPGPGGPVHDGKHGRAVEGAGFRKEYTEDDNVAMVRELIQKMQAEAKASGAPTDYLDDVVVIPWTRYHLWLEEFKKYPRGEGTGVRSVEGADVQRVFFRGLRDMAGRTVG